MGVSPNYSSAAQQNPYLPTPPARIHAFPGKPAPASPTRQNTQAGHVVDEAKWRTTNLRYLGYADEVGEFLRPYLLGAGGFAGYFISTLYGLADMISTAKTLNKHEQVPTGERHKKIGMELAVLGTFHFVATLLIPPRIIGKTVKWFDHFLNGNEEKGTKGRLDRLQENRRLQSLFNANRMETANQRFLPLVQTLGKGTATALTPLQKAIHKMPALKHTPIFGEFFKEIDEEIHGLRHIPKFTQKNMIRLVFQKPLPVLVGIAMVPLIAHPFDQLTEWVLDWTLRPLFGINKITKASDGKLQSEKNKTFWNLEDAKQKATALLTAPANQTQPAPSLPVAQTAMVTAPLVAATQLQSPFQQWMHHVPQALKRELRREESVLVR